MGNKHKTKKVKKTNNKNRQSERGEEKRKKKLQHRFMSHKNSSENIENDVHLVSLTFPLIPDA